MGADQKRQRQQRRRQTHNIQTKRPNQSNQFKCLWSAGPAVRLSVCLSAHFYINNLAYSRRSTQTLARLRLNWRHLRPPSSPNDRIIPSNGSTLNLLASLAEDDKTFGLLLALLLVLVFVVWFVELRQASNFTTIGEQIDAKLLSKAPTSRDHNRQMLRHRDKLAHQRQRGAPCAPGMPKATGSRGAPQAE